MKQINLIVLSLLVFVSGCASSYYFVSDEFTIQGDVNVDNFDSYTVEVGRGLNPKTFDGAGITIRNDGKRIMRDEAIARINPAHLVDGFNTVRISVKDKEGNVFYDYSYVYVNNNKIAYPKGDMIFRLINETPANLPPRYYIIEDSSRVCEGCVVIYIGSHEEDEDEEKEDEEEFEKRIEGSKIDIIGKINKDNLLRHEIDYTYDSDRRTWFNKGIELLPLTEGYIDGEKLGTLDLKELKYNGPLTIRLKVTDKDGAVSTETVYVLVESKIYQDLESTGESNILNLEENNVNGFISAGVEKLETPANQAEVWIRFAVLKDRVPLTLLEKQTFDLSNVDLEGFSIDKPGKYRLYAEFDSGKEVKKDYYEFTVVNKLEETCDDGIERNSCSIGMKPFYCNDDLQLINQCQYCGCEIGTCQENGSCS